MVKSMKHLMLLIFLKISKSIWRNNMKKLLITISPFCAVLFVLMWLSLGLKGAFVFFGVVLFIVVLAFMFVKWVEFVDKHIKD